MDKKLGVNIDHIATLREARKCDYPDPVKAALICENAGADSITAHLREDRRHIQDDDIVRLKENIKTRLNLEMSINSDIVNFALDIVPDEVCIVPENRMEVTTEGGLDVIRSLNELKKIIYMMHNKHIIVSLFVEPDKVQIGAAKDTGAHYIELHTGRYANLKDKALREMELEKIEEAAKFAHSIGLGVNAGHGLTLDNIEPLLFINEIETFNIGHSIISHAIFVGLEQAVKDMLLKIKGKI